MPREIDSAVFPHLDADLDRVRDVLGPVQFQGRPELTALTDEGPDSSRRLVRPTLTLLSYYLLTDPAVPAEDQVVRAAAAMELLHLGSLYHDDVIDHAYQRRGRPNANAVWGSHMAPLSCQGVVCRSGLFWLVVSPGCGLSEVPVCGVGPVALESRVAPDCPPGLAVCRCCWSASMRA